MKKLAITLAVLGFCLPLSAQQTSLDALKTASGGKEAAAVPVPAPPAAVPAAKTDKAVMPRRVVKFLSGGKAEKNLGCSVTDQSGTLDSWYCRNSEGKIRCYADVKVDGKTFRVWGGCGSSYSDCWWSGSMAVKDPCDNIEVDPFPSQPPVTGCRVKDQSGTMDSWACKDHEGKIRCYADVTANGSSFRIYGGCFNSYSDCWWSGPGAVNPCD